MTETITRVRTTRSIDVGCGGTLRRRARGFDIYTDISPCSEDFDGEFVQTPLEDMNMFADKEFDHVRAHHCIEHCTDPDAACREIVRIGKAGILSFPPMQAEVMFGRSDHNWFVCVDHGRLLFIKKRHASYGVPRAVTRCELNVNFKWEGGFEWQVVA